MWAVVFLHVADLLEILFLRKQKTKQKPNTIEAKTIVLLDTLEFGAQRGAILYGPSKTTLLL